MTAANRYAHLERERRFLLAAGPLEPVPGGVLRRIEDSYLRGTRLRLRRVRQDGCADVHKLGQKVRPDPSRPSTVEHTTLYLDRTEYESLRTLAGDALTKTRTSVPWDDLTMAVDVFSGELAGLVLAEVDLGDRPDLPPGPPLSWLAEVTDDERFTGGALARTSAAHLALVLQDWPAARRS